MTPSELKEKTKAELKKLNLELKEELFRLKIKKATGQLEKTHRLGELRRDLARIYTIERGVTK
ncbi:MAG: 50S ribosomal protein L29 [Deltaproteobacteria bacterium]|nr:50S ribosomal protein L29 [Deltaproteobacteria bacterium]